MNKNDPPMQSRKKRKLRESLPETNKLSPFVVSSSGCALPQSLICAICNEILKEPHSIFCGHSFCYNCITEHINESNSATCPVCDLEIIGSIFPNHSLKQQLEISCNIAETESLTFTPANRCQDCLRNFTVNKDEPYCSFHRSIRKLDLDKCKDRHRLQELIREKRHHFKETIENNNLLIYNNVIKMFIEKKYKQYEKAFEEYQSDIQFFKECLETPVNEKNSQESTAMHIDNTDNLPDIEIESNLIPNIKNEGQQNEENKYVSEQTERLIPFLDELEKEFDICGKNKQLFSTKLFEILKITKSRTFATLAYADRLNCNDKLKQLVTSIEINKEGDYCAIAGVLKTVKIFDIRNLVENSLPDRYNPWKNQSCLVLNNRHKISALSWNFFYSNSLISADYEGNIFLWDFFTKKAVKLFKNQKNRCFDVEFSPSEPNYFISAAEDSTVRLWSIKSENDLISISPPQQTEVYTAKFNPSRHNEIAFGGSNRKIYIYDLRHYIKPLQILCSHSERINHSAFLNGNEFASSSIDGSIKIWQIQDGHQFTEARTLTGHVNKDLFIGLSANDPYIACGSEDNSVYIYHKDFIFPICVHNFDSDIADIYKTTNPEFFSYRKSSISAVCWQPNTQFLLMGNNSGLIRNVNLY